MPTLDPTILALLSIFGGALLTIIAGGIGALVAWNREHNKWVREKRYEAFVTLQALLLDLDLARLNLDAIKSTGDMTSAQLQRSHERAQVLQARFDRLVESVGTAATPIVVLGPDSVRECVSDILKMEMNDSGWAAAKDRLHTAMHAALKIKD